MTGTVPQQNLQPPQGALQFQPPKIGLGNGFQIGREPMQQQQVEHPNLQGALNPGLTVPNLATPNIAKPQLSGASGPLLSERKLDGVALPSMNFDFGVKR